jgi:hypothetical protein
MDDRIIAGLKDRDIRYKASACKGAKRTETVDLGENKANINLANVFHPPISTCYTKNI